MRRASSKPVHSTLKMNVIDGSEVKCSFGGTSIVNFLEGSWIFARLLKRRAERQAADLHFSVASDANSFHKELFGWGFGRVTVGGPGGPPLRKF